MTAQASRVRSGDRELMLCGARLLKAAINVLVLVPQCGRHSGSEGFQEVFLFTDSLRPIRGVHLKEAGDDAFRSVEPGAVDRLGRWNITDDGIRGFTAPIATIENPLQHTQVIAEAWPHEL